MIRVFSAMAALALPALMAFPAVAQGDAGDAVAPETDRILWCASAFYWLAASAEDSGDIPEAEQYDRWSSHLTNFAGQALTALGYAPERIEALITRYDEQTLQEIGSPEASHDIVACAELAPPEE